MAPQVDFCIIGGGVIGLAIARELLQQDPKARVLVLEAESDSTAHASGRNSGVLHAGFYYAPDSLKAALTRRGNELLKTFCSQEAVPVRECGKVVVTRSAAELPQLKELHRRGVANGVPVELISPRRLAELEPLARTHEQALWSPTTAVADPKAVVGALAKDVRTRGGQIWYRSRALAARPNEVLVSRGSDPVAGGQAADPDNTMGTNDGLSDQSQRSATPAQSPVARMPGPTATAHRSGARGRVSAGTVGTGHAKSNKAQQPTGKSDLLRIDVGHIINCAGLQADRVAQWFDMCPDYQVVPFKGMYRYGNWPAFQLQRLVYPVPDPRNPFLGVHATTTVTGATKIGPTAVPVLGRDNYRGLQGLSAAEVADSLLGLAKFARSREQDAIALTRAELPKYATSVLAREAAELVPSIRAQDFTRKGEPGIRAQLVNKATGGLEMDFLVRGDRSSTHVLNAVSPAWTSALAVAEHVVSGLATP